MNSSVRLVKQPLPPYPEPSALTVSTITYLSYFNTYVDIHQLFYQLPLVQETDIGIHTLKSYEKLDIYHLTDSQKNIVDQHINSLDEKRLMKLFETIDARLLTERQKVVYDHYLANLTKEQLTLYEKKTAVKKNKLVIKWTRTATQEAFPEIVTTFFQNQMTAMWNYQNEHGVIASGHSMIFSNGSIKSVGLKNELQVELSNQMLLEQLRHALSVVSPHVIQRVMLSPPPPVATTTTTTTSTTLEKKKTQPKQHKPPTEAFTSPDDLLCVHHHICMVNTDFKTHITISRQDICRIIKRHYGIIVTYEPEIYPGVKICYSWNEDYLDRSRYDEGKCYCTGRCTGCEDRPAKGNGNCKIVTICVFLSGNIIITGGKSIQQTTDAYNFINRILRTHYEEIVFVEPIFENDEETVPIESPAILPKKEIIKIAVHP